MLDIDCLGTDPNVPFISHEALVKLLNFPLPLFPQFYSGDNNEVLLPWIVVNIKCINIYEVFGTVLAM